MTSRRIELHAAASAVLGLTLTLCFTACGEDGGDGTTSTGGSSSMGTGGMGNGGVASSGGSGAMTATGGSGPVTGGVPGAGGGPAAGGATGGSPGAGGAATGGAMSGGAPTTGGGSGTGGSGGATGGASSGGTGGSGPTADACKVAPITAEMRTRYQNMNDPYYTKYAITSGGVVAATGALVDDAALVRYCQLLEEMFSNDAVRAPVVSSKMWFTMIGQEEQLSSLPQINRQYGTSLNARARGLGGLTPTICAEDSIMCMPGDKWKGDCICAHETGHTMWSSGIARVPELSRRLTEITNETRSSGRLANAYVWQDGNESGMMAWGVQAWYDCAINGTRGAYHSDINTRAELQSQLPEFYQFLSEIMPSDNKYKDCYAK